MKETRKGMLLVLSGPSGAGKGTLAGLLMKQDASFQFSVSATTRAPRTGEINGVHYHFLDDAAFDALVAEGAFLEHANVHGHRYGTLKSEVDKILDKGCNVLLDIDVQGAAMVMKAKPDAVSVFILPPSFTELRRRLEGRKTDAQEEIERRLNNARAEISQLGSYQYVIVNGSSPEGASRTLKAIVDAEKQRTARCIIELDD